jgi:hypothetical protein
MEELLLKESQVACMSVLKMRKKQVEVRGAGGARGKKENAYMK